MRVSRFVILLSAHFLLAGCTPPPALTRPDGAEPILPSYDTAIVLDFENLVEKPDSWTGDYEEFARETEACRVRLANKIQQQLEKDGVFTTVIRQPSEVPGLRITGEIVERMQWVLFAQMLGSPDVEMEVRIIFEDNLTGEHIGDLYCRNYCGVKEQKWVVTDKFNDMMNAIAVRVSEVIQEARQGASASG